MKKRVILANDGVAINLNSIIGFLNDVSNYFSFELYQHNVGITDTVITPRTYTKLGLNISDDIYFIMIFTDKQYHNNFFLSQRITLSSHHFSDGTILQVCIRTMELPTSWQIILL